MSDEKQEGVEQRPTKAQRAVLEHLHAGATIVWIAGERPYVKLPNGMAVDVQRATVLNMHRARWITHAGTLGRSWYEITPTARAALTKDQS